MADLYTAMAVMQGSTNLPRDRWVNTWHFSDDASDLTHDEAADQVAQVLNDFYLQPTQVVVNGANRTIFSLLSNEIIGLEYRVYRDTDPTPRDAEVRQPGIALPARGAPTMPEEVACVLTLHTDFRSQRGRGRLFIGPFGGLVTPLVVQAGRTRVAPAIRETIARKAIEARANVQTTSLRWVIKSTRGPVNEVIGGYVDDAWDTMRKRGTDPTVRTGWGTVQGIG